MNSDKYPAVVGIVTLGVVLFLSSCSAGQANVNPQQALFASAPDASIAVECGPGNLVVGDLNNDGKSDLVAACERRTLPDSIAKHRWPRTLS